MFRRAIATLLCCALTAGAPGPGSQAAAQVLGQAGSGAARVELVPAPQSDMSLGTPAPLATVELAPSAPTPLTTAELPSSAPAPLTAAPLTAAGQAVASPLTTTELAPPPSTPNALPVQHVPNAALATGQPETGAPDGRPAGEPTALGTLTALDSGPGEGASAPLSQTWGHQTSIYDANSRRPAPLTAAGQAPDGADDVVVEAAPASRRSPRWWAVAAAGLALLAASAGIPGMAPARAQAPPTPAGRVSPAPVAPAAPAKLPASPVSVRLATDQAEYALADPIGLQATLTNDSKELASVPAAEIARTLEQALGPDFKVRALQNGEVPVPAGGTVHTEFDIEVVRLPKDLAQGGELKVQVAATRVVHQGKTLELPGFEFKLKSSLQADEKEQQEPAGVEPWQTDARLDVGTLAIWVAVFGALGFALWRWQRPGKLKGTEGPEDGARHPSADEIRAFAREEFDRLERELGDGLSSQEAYRRVSAALGAHLAAAFDLGRPGVGVLAATESLLDLVRRVPEGSLDQGARELLERVARHAEEVLYQGKTLLPGTAIEDVKAARELVPTPKPKPRRAGPAGPSGTAALGMMPLLAMGDWLPHKSISEALNLFNQPGWLFLLAVPATFLLLKLFGSRRPKPAFTAPSKELVVGRSTLRSTLAWLPSLFFYAALGLGILGAADPRWGLASRARSVPSLDRIVALDNSQSMEEGGKIDDAKAATELFLDRQAGTTNRVGVLMFNSRPQLIQPLTTEHEQTKAAIAGVRPEGGTDIAAALEEALEHLLEARIVDSDAPGAEKLRKALRAGELSDALEAAARDPELNRILYDHPPHWAILLLSDGGTFSAKRALEVAQRAKDLGVRIDAAVMPALDGNPQLMRDISRLTGGEFLNAGNREAMLKSFERADQLEKEWVKAFAPPERTSHGRDFAAAAAVALLAALILRLSLLPETLRPPRMRGAAAALAVLLLLSSWGAAPALAQEPGPALPQAPRASQAPQKDGGGWVEGLSPFREAPEMREGTELFRQGKYAEAARVFRRAKDKYPDLPEADLFRGMAHRRAGQEEAAKRAFEDAAATARKEGRSDALGATLLEQGNAALKAGDPSAARDFYRQAMRLPAPKSAAQRERFEVVQKAARGNFEKALRQEAARPQPGQGQGEGKDSAQQPPDAKQDQNQNQNQNQQNSGEGQPKQGQPSQSKEPPKDGKPGKGSGDPTSAQPKDQKKSGQGDPSQANPNNPKTNPQGRQPSVAEPSEAQQRQRAAERALEQMRKDAEKRRPFDYGRAWSVFPVAALPLLFGAQTQDLTFSWTNHSLLYLAILVPVLLGAWAWRQAAKRLEQARPWAQWKLPRLAWSWSPLRRFLARTGLVLASLALALVAWAEPHWGTRNDSFGYGGQKIVVMVDVSKSHLLEEHGSFEEALEGLDRWLQWLENGHAGDQVTVVPFAGEAGRGALSHDHRAALLRLYRLRRDANNLKEGSNLVAAVDRAIEIVEAAKEGPAGGVAIFVSDGGENTEGLAEAGLRAKAKNVRILALGGGTAAGGRMRVPERYRDLTGGEFISRNGVPVTVHRNDAALELLAKASGGRYERADGGKGMDRLLAAVAQEESKGKEVQVDVQRAWTEPLLVGAVLLLALGLSPLLAGPGSRKEETEEPKDHLEQARETAKRLRLDEILRRKFRTLLTSRSGPEKVGSMPLTDQPQRLIDHKATARDPEGELQAKVFEPNPRIPLYLVMKLKKGASAARAAAAESAAALVFASARENMPVHVILVGDRALQMLPPRQGGTYAEDLYRILQQEGPADGTHADLATALRAVLEKRPGLVAVLSDFSDSDYESLLTAVAERHALLPVAIESALESLPAAGRVALEDPETGAEAVLDTEDSVVRQTVQARVEQRRQHLLAAAGPANPVVFLTDGGGHLEGLERYFQLKPWKQ